MSHMTCKCGASMWDGDGHIVYDVYSFKDLNAYILDNDKKHLMMHMKKWHPFMKIIVIFGCVMNVKQYICGVINPNIVIDNLLLRKN